MLQPVIGLEIHLQVKTNSKMFCRCKSQYFDSDPNTHVCPVCFGLPGALPVPNKEAFEKCIKLALALNCKINKETKFDRKNYFYPDLPKGYQISQFDQPVGEDGFVEIEVEGDSRRIRIQRVHIEEDTGKSIHAENDETLLDYNKSGVPLIEIVTYPDFVDVDEVTAFAKRLRQIARYNDISDAQMQKGQMRYELNISVRKPEVDGEKGLPKYKVEVKNIGSISVLEKVINYEINRQSELLDKGEKIISQTRGLKGMTGETLFQRSKETSDDYRYFPEPDIPPIHISNETIEKLSSSLVEQPTQRKLRYISLGLESEQADIFVEDQILGNWFDILLNLIALKSSNNKGLPKEIAKWIIGDIAAYLEKKSINIDQISFDQSWLFELVQLVTDRKITGTVAKKLIAEEFEKLSGDSIYKTNFNVLDEVTKRGWILVSDSAEIEKFVEQALAENQKVVADVSKNPNAIKFLVGQVMKMSKGTLSPKDVEDAIRTRLKI